MRKIRKVFNIKIISIAVAFFITSTAYGTELSKMALLRIPHQTSTDENRARVQRALEETQSILDSKRTISSTGAEYERETSMRLKVFKGFEVFINLREAKHLFERLKGLCDIGKSERFRHVIPLLLAAKERLKNPDEPHKMFDPYYRYPSNCKPCSVHAMRILDEYHFKVKLRTIEFPEEIYPDLNIDRHVFVVTEIGGKEFIIDIAADQFEPLGENKWADLGVVVLPIDVVKQDPTRFWMYPGSRALADSSAQLSKKVMPATATRTGI